VRLELAPVTVARGGPCVRTQLLGGRLPSGWAFRRHRRIRNNLWCARSALHLETGKRVDRLTVDLQPEVARGMGFVDEPGLAAIDALMRRVFEHGRSVGALVSAGTARLATT
jgi:UTP:GlnB (protein PII) uridylyltransferase